MSFKQTAKQPNVIWYLVDQMRAQAMSIAGDPNLHTPNLDRLARDGVYFEKACMGFPLCCPARGSLLSGQYPHQCIPGHEFRLPPTVATVATPFNEAGYHTAWLGKWHVDGHFERHGRGALHTVPRQRRGGFRTWIGYENNNSQYDCWVHGHRDDQSVEHYRLPGHETDALTDLLIEEISEHKDRPFFAACSVQPPHDPYTAPAEFAGRHNPANLILRRNVPPIIELEETVRKELAGYYALIEHIDANVGRLLNKLEQLGIADHTYIVFFSDHGDNHGSHGYRRKMTPLEESIRVPCMIWGGHYRHYRNSKTVDHVINHVDIAPTSLGLADIAVPTDMRGYDYSPLAKNTHWCAEAPNEALLQCIVPTQHYQSIDYPWRGLVTRDGWKYVATPGQPMYLFDLNKDPYELCNMAHTSQGRPKRKELNDRLAELLRREHDDFLLPEFTETGSPICTQNAAEVWRKKEAEYVSDR